MADYSTPAELLLVLDMREAVATAMATLTDSLSTWVEDLHHFAEEAGLGEDGDE